MGVFLTPQLDVETVDELLCDGRGVDRVTKMFEYYSSTLARIIRVEVGFLTDYASIPRFPFMYWLLGGRARKEALIHDWLFHHHEVCDEQTANRVLLEAMEDCKQPQWVRWLIYLGVKFGGKSSWEEDAAGNGHSIINGRIV